MAGYLTGYRVCFVLLTTMQVGFCQSYQTGRHPACGDGPDPVDGF